MTAGGGLDALAELFWRDGVVVAPAIADEDTVDALRRLADDVVEHPRPLHTTDGEARPDSYLWLTEPACVDAIVTAGLSRLAARVLRSRRVRLYYDQVFAKPVGRSVATEWHTDASYWPVAGSQVCSIWLALDAAGPASGGLRYGVGDPPRERSIELMPGDAVIHRGDALHASFPNTDPTNNRRAYVTRWLGDDMRFRSRPGLGAFPMDVGLRDGDDFDHLLFPVLWDEAWT
jgi:hypothetical protein